MREDTLSLITDPEELGSAYSDWYAKLCEGAVDRGRHWSVVEYQMSFRMFRKQVGSRKVDLWLGSSSNAAVQINESKGDENRLGGVGRARDGRRFVLRQGYLQSNDASGNEIIRDEDFQARTGLMPWKVMFGNVAAKRPWYIVTPLDGVTGEEVRRATAEFVQRCWNARQWGQVAAADQERLDTYLGRGERGGTFTVVANPDPRIVLRRQGEVWEALEQTLAEKDVELRKPRHARGYEVDAEVCAPGQALLVEIKTSCSAADVYTGVGQLLVYPRLLQNLDNHRRVLLLPGRSTKELAQALHGIGIELHTYSLNVGKSGVSVKFSEQFLSACGI